MSQIINKLKSNIFNVPGWHTNRKIIVFESDDWGSIRIPSRETYNYLKRNGYLVDESPYCKDCLESNDDLAALLEVLASIYNINDQHPIITLNYIMANPDFIKIRQLLFENYFYETFTDSYNNYPNHDRSFKLLNEGVKNGVLRPQLHGREHLNFKRWLNYLKNGHSETRNLFDLHMVGLPISISREERRDFQRAFDYDNIIDGNDSCSVMADACKLFQTIWGFTPDSFIAPNFFWDDNIEKCLITHGIKYFQGQRAQFLTDYRGNYTAKYHFTGQKNKLGQVYLIRTCFFEPSFNLNQDWVDSCLNDISLAFKWWKPAIISTHRVNYIGSIDSENRDRGLKELNKLIKTIIRNWPNVEFMSSDKLGDLITLNENSEAK